MTGGTRTGMILTSDLHKSTLATYPFNTVMKERYSKTRQKHGTIFFLLVKCK